jgi:hypothetical protein
VFDLPEVQHDLRNVVKFDSVTLEATRLLTRDVLTPLLDSWTESNSDYFPVLDLGAERTRFLKESATGFVAMWTQGFNVAAALMGRQAGPMDDKLAPQPGVGSVFSRAMSARARRGGTVSTEDSLEYPSMPQLLHNRWVFEATMELPRGPQSWHRWVADFIRVEESLHRGTSGFVDTAFYGKSERYMRRFGAPVEVVTAVRFVRSVAEWDFKTASQAVDEMLAIGSAATDILATDFMRDGGVIAKLKDRDVAGARRLYDRLSKEADTRPPSHFQSRLLEAHLLAAERTGG